MTSHHILLDSILVEGRLRQVDAAEVDRIALSMAETGQLQAVEVTPAGQAGRYRLVIGGHRMAAARKLGWATILATIFEGSADAIRLREIDENLYRRELSPFDQAAFLTERRDVCQRLGHLPKGRGGKETGRSANLALRTFEDELATKFGIGRRTLFRALQRRSAIHPTVWECLAGTKLAERGSALDALAAMPADKQRAALDWWLSAPVLGQPRPSFAEMCRVTAGGLPAKARRPARAAWP